MNRHNAAMPGRIHVVSHGPHCLDGVTAAAAVARYYEGRAQVVPHFASNSEIDGVLRSLQLDPAVDAELWVTDISWKDPATDAHLRALSNAGIRVFWIDHHRTALERVRAGKVSVPFADSVLSEEYAASKLLFRYLSGRGEQEGRPAPGFQRFAPVVEMADDNDRWLHRIPGSRELAWVVRALGPDSYDDIVRLDEDVRYTPRMQAARDRVGAEIARSLAVAAHSRVERRVGDVRLVVAVCDGHPSEVADAWGKTATNTVFALYDAKSLAVSLRRSPDCKVDLSHIAAQLGGGGHAAAAGCELPEVRAALAAVVADRIEGRLE
jgi:oligoribonuclease NrnB/cAMP/cGMP phosphodiesterase (DHH superfamily)